MGGTTNPQGASRSRYYMLEEEVGRAKARTPKFGGGSSLRKTLALLTSLHYLKFQFGKGARYTVPLPIYLDQAPGP